MCNDLNDAMALQKDLDIPEEQKAMMLIRACKNSIDKLQKKFVAHVADANNRLVEISDEQKELRRILKEHGEALKEIKDAQLAAAHDATKWQVVVQICKALFGDMKRCIMTTVWFALILGAVHFGELIELLKALI